MTLRLTIPITVFLLQVAADTLTSLLISVQILCGSYLPIVHEVSTNLGTWAQGELEGDIISDIAPLLLSLHVLAFQKQEHWFPCIHICSCLLYTSPSPRD